MTATTTERWTYRLRRLHAGEERGACFAPANHAQRCSASLESAYHCTATSELVNPETGEVSKGQERTSYACTNHAAWLSGRVGLPFPPTADKE